MFGLEILEFLFGLLRAGYRMMPARIEFFPPSNEAGPDTPDVSWWHIRIGIKHSKFFRKHQIEDAEIWFIPYRGNKKRGSGIALRWQTRNGFAAQVKLEYGRPRLVPVVWRREGRGQKDGVAFITNENFLLRKEGKWPQNSWVDVLWKLEVRAAGYKTWQSPDFYRIKLPAKDESNDSFRIEIVKAR